MAPQRGPSVDTAKGTRHSWRWELAVIWDADWNRTWQEGRTLVGKHGEESFQVQQRLEGLPGTLATSARTSSGHHLQGSQGWALEGACPRLWMQGARFWEPKGRAPPEGIILLGPLKDQARLTLELPLLSRAVGWGTLCWPYRALP